MENTRTTASTEIKPPKLFVIPAGTKVTACSKCQAPLYFVGKMPLRAVPKCFHAGKRVTIDTPDAVPPSLSKEGKGFSHFIDCPNANDFRRK